LRVVVTPEDLSRLGLTSYEAKAYLALIRRDASTAGEVAEIGKLPRQRIYDVLARLVHKGLAVARPGSPTRYSASPPALAIERLLSEHRHELRQRESDAKRLIEQLAPAFEAGQNHSEPLGYIEVLRDPGAIASRFAELQAGVQDEILVFTKPPYAVAPQENREGLHLARSHRARSVYEFSLFDDPAHVEAVRHFIDAGSEARFVRKLPLKLAIIDQTIVMFGMQDPVAGEGGLTIVVVEHPSLAQLLKIAFDAVWAQGVTLDQAAQLVEQPQTAGLPDPPH
jgi:sugar-specific transcriptional regulator TrmB